MTMTVSHSSMSLFWVVKRVKTSYWCHRRCGRQMQNYLKVCLLPLRYYILDWSTSWLVLAHISLLLIFVNLCPFSQPCSHCLPLRLISYCFAVVEQLIRGIEKYQGWVKVHFLIKYPQRPNLQDHSCCLIKLIYLYLPLHFPLFVVC